MLALAACDREERRYRDPALPAPAGAVPHVPLRAGPGGAVAAFPNPYEDNAWAMSEGKQLYFWFNCNGCHAMGGGGMGPPLMDDAWIYGSDPGQIFATIVEGRPNGMPAFGGRLSEQQVWQLVTYVRAMSGLSRFDVPSSRSDHMTTRPSELSMPEQPPKQAVSPR